MGAPPNTYGALVLLACSVIFFNTLPSFRMSLARSVEARRSRSAPLRAPPSTPREATRAGHWHLPDRPAGEVPAADSRRTPGRSGSCRGWPGNRREPRAPGDDHRAAVAVWGMVLAGAVAFGRQRGRRAADAGHMGPWGQGALSAGWLADPGRRHELRYWDGSGGPNTPLTAESKGSIPCERSPAVRRGGVAFCRPHGRLR